MAEKVSEKSIEAYLRNQVRKIGGRAYKFTSPGNAGVPDRLVMLPGGDLFFVELKAPGGKTTKLQEKRIKELEMLGQVVFIADSREAVDKILALYG